MKILIGTVKSILLFGSIGGAMLLEYFHRSHHVAMSLMFFFCGYLVYLNVTSPEWKEAYGRNVKPDDGIEDYRDYIQSLNDDQLAKNAIELHTVIRLIEKWNPPREVLEVRLDETRQEWIRRHPH